MSEEEIQQCEANRANCVKSFPSKVLKKEASFYDRIKRSKANSIRKLGAIYSLTDEVYEHVSKYTPCKKGCASCCHYNVSVSELEIEQIEQQTNYKRKKEYSPKANFHGVPCPFLKNDSCSIYDSIPCKPENSLSIKLTTISFTEIEKAYRDTAKPESGHYDIRQVF